MEDKAWTEIKEKIAELRVVKIIDEYSVVTNYGEEDGAQTGDVLEVFAKGDVVVDPLTQERLGVLESVKASLIVEKAYPKMSVCKSYFCPETVKGSERGKLSVNIESISGGFPDRKIQVGDSLVKKLGAKPFCV